MEHSAEVQDFLRDKFTKQEIYLLLQQETTALNKQSYSLALRTAREAQQAFWYERVDTQRDFLQDSATGGGVGAHWNSLHDGLMASERLDLALHVMDQSVHGVELPRVRAHREIFLEIAFPAGIPAAKDVWIVRDPDAGVDCPLRDSPYTGLHCRIQLLSSAIRYKPLLPGPEACCCSSAIPFKPQDPSKRTYCAPHDPFLLRRYSGTDAIATSSALDDDGLFELNFHDERYLPFEFCGAISTWRIELPPANNAFDFDSLTDFIIKLNYTAREGGPELGAAKMAIIGQQLPGDGLRYFYVCHEFQDEWGRVFASRQHQQRREDDEQRDRDFDLRFTRNMFPFLPGGSRRAVVVTRIHIFIQTEAAEEEDGDGRDHIRLRYIAPGHGYKRPAGGSHCSACDGGMAGEKCKEIVCRRTECPCPCPGRGGGGSCEAEAGYQGLAYGACRKEHHCACARSCSSLTLFHGIIDNVSIGALAARPRERAGRDAVGELRLPPLLECESITEAYLVCEYVAFEKGRHNTAERTREREEGRGRPLHADVDLGLRARSGLSLY